MLGHCQKKNNLTNLLQLLLNYYCPIKNIGYLDFGLNTNLVDDF